MLSSLLLSATRISKNIEKNELLYQDPCVAKNEVRKKELFWMILTQASDCERFTLS